MKYLPLVLTSLSRKKLRTLFTLLSIFIAFLLFGYLAAIKAAFTSGVEVAGVDRLIMTDKITIINLLPVAYKNRILATEGVDAAVQSTWFGGYYQEPRNMFAQFPVVPEEYLDIYPEIVLTDAERRAWLEDRGSAIIGRALADRFGWQVGDRVPLISPIWRNKDGTNTWEFDIAGIFDAGKDGFDTSGMLFHHEFFRQGRAFGEGLVGWYVIRVADPAQSEAVARRLDAQFANSSNETRTVPEKAFMQGFLNQVGNISAIFSAIVTVVVFTLLLITGNTVAQSVRERTGELAVMSILGFSRLRLLGLVFFESFLLAIVGGGLGLLVAYALVESGGDPTNGFLPAFFIPADSLWAGVALVLAVGLVSGAFPANRALRLQHVDALRRVG
jgi:putative ABC transport system permease protein